MPSASDAQTSFLGGEISKTAQGRFDDPIYKIALGICLNWIPLEPGAKTRRPGSMFGGTTRSGRPGRVTSLAFKQSAPYTVEFTDGFIRFRDGALFVTTNDAVGVGTISTANPAVVQTNAAVTWATGDQAFFTLPGVAFPLLQNRLFTLTKIDTTHFSLADAVTGATIDGSTLVLGAPSAVGTTISRVADFASPYVGGQWQSSTLRSIPCDIALTNGSTSGVVLLNAVTQPYVVQVVAQPTASAFATFSVSSAVFKDGPYFDPVPGGTLATPSGTTGNVTLSLSFFTYDATRSYATGDYVTSAGTNYRSLIDANLNNTPASSPAAWVAVSSADAIGANGFQASDVGRMVRLFSEPLLWDSAHTYSSGDVVAYGGTGLAGFGAGYWKSLAGSNTGNIPGTDTTHWAIATNAALWTWGKIISLSNIVDRALVGSVNIGNMTGDGGVNAPFNGTFAQTSGNCAGLLQAWSGITHDNVIVDGYVGKNYSGASSQKIAQAIVYPSSDFGFGFFKVTPGQFAIQNIIGITFTLRASNTPPVSPSSGTAIGSTVLGANQTTPVTIISTDQTTSYNYVWIEIFYRFEILTADSGASGTIEIFIGQISYFNPPGSGTSQGIVVQLLGANLLYSTAVRSWRLGLYSNTTGWPTCGTFHEGRLWLSGAVPNRIDSSRSNDIFNMAPTDPSGAVPTNAGISYTFNAKDTNPIFWMESDERGIICGTQGGEWLVAATTQNLPLSPTNIQAHRATKNGCANIEPVRTGQTIAYVQRGARKLLEYFADVFSGRLTAPNLTRDSKHLTETFLQEIAYQSELAPIVWGRRTDGELVGWTYKRENMMSSQGPSFIAGHRHTLGSGRLVESICSGPSTDGNLDTLTMVTNDPATNVRHVELLTNIWDEDQDPTTAWQLDDAVTPTSFTVAGTTLTINGLWHLNGKTATAFVAGIDAGDYLVTNGSITVPLDGTAGSTNGQSPLNINANPGQVTASTTIVVGFTYNSDAQVLRPGPQKDSGAAKGPAAGQVGRSEQIAVLVQDAAGGQTRKGLQFGSFFDKLDPALFRTPDQTLIAENVLFSGVHWTPVNNPYTRDEGQLCWRINRAYPATICWLSSYQQTQG